MLQQLKFSTRLYWGFGVILMLIIGLISFSYVQVKKISDYTTIFYEHPFVVINTIHEIHNDVANTQILLNKYIDDEKQISKDTMLSHLSKIENEITVQLNIVKDIYLGNKQEITDAEIAFKKLKSLNSEVVNYGINKNYNAAKDFFKLQWNEESNNFKQKLNVVLKFANSKASSIFANMQASKNATQFWLLIFSIILFLICAFIAWYIARSISMPIHSIIARINKITNTQNINPNQLKSEISIIQNSVEELSKAYQTIHNSKINLETNIEERYKDLKESEERLRLSLESSEDMITIHDFEGKYLYYNGPEKYSINPLSIVEKTPFDFFEKEIAIQITEQIKKTAITGEPSLLEIYVNWLGKMTWFEEKIYPLKKDNKIISVVKICSDISNRKKIENELILAKENAEETQRHLIQITNNIPVIIGHVSKDLKYLFANELYEDLFGIPNTIIVGKSVEEILGKKYLENSYPNILKVLSGETIKFETVVINTKNQPINILATYIPEFNRNEVVGFFVLAVDITQLKNTEIELQKAKEKAEENEIKLIDAQRTAHIGHWNWDIKLQTLSWSDEIFNILGVSKDTFVKSSENLDKTVHPDDFKEYLERRNLAIQTGSDVDITHRIIRPNGEIRFVHQLSKIFRDENNQITSILGTIQDITERKQLEIDLTLAKEKAEENDRLKTAFLNNISHELKTPMNAIQGFSEILSNHNLPEEKRNNYISIIKDSSSQLLKIVEDLIAISSLETKQEKTTIAPVCVNDMLQYLLTLFTSAAHTQKILLTTKHALTDKQSEVLTDKNKLIKIMSKLIDNALKFTLNGSIEFGYTNKQEHDSVTMEFYVKDTGIGIDKNMQNKIFESFTQAEFGLSRTYEGTGLGLSISKGYAELLGGKIWVESEIDKGSTFYFTIPYLPVNIEGAE